MNKICLNILRERAQNWMLEAREAKFFRNMVAYRRIGHKRNDEIREELGIFWTKSWSYRL
jgi:hypothetical protein